MDILETMMQQHHEEVLFTTDPVSGLKAIIAIHSTALGPALGGTRFFAYENEEAALADVLRLSQAMTLKAAAAGLDLGGGKGVIIGDPRQLRADPVRAERMFRAYARAVDSLGGRYITAEDVGTTVDDIVMMARETRHVAGLPTSHGGSGDPSPATAHGVFAGMEAVATHLWEQRSLEGRRVMVQGVGKVGAALVDLLTEAGAVVTISDVNSGKVKRVSAQSGCKVVDVGDAFDVECDIFAPCAMGGALNEETIPRLTASAVVGSANNQLATEKDAQRLLDRGIVYAPDFVVNAGGIINIMPEVRGLPYSWELLSGAIAGIYDTTRNVLRRAAELDTDTHQAAVALAQIRLDTIGSLGLRRSTDD